MHVRGCHAQECQFAVTLRMSIFARAQELGITQSFTYFRGEIALWGEKTSSWPLKFVNVWGGDLNLRGIFPP